MDHNNNLLFKKFNNRGFTLIETASVIAIIAFFVLPSIALWGVGFNSLERSEANTNSISIAKSIFSDIDKGLEFNKIMLKKEDYDFKDSSKLDDIYEVFPVKDFLSDKEKDFYFVYTNDSKVYTKVTKSEYDLGKPPIAIPLIDFFGDRTVANLSLMVRVNMKLIDFEPKSYSSVESSGSYTDASSDLTLEWLRVEVIIENPCGAEKKMRSKTRYLKFYAINQD